MKSKTTHSLLAAITACALTTFALGEGDKQKHAGKDMQDMKHKSASTLQKVGRTTEQQVDQQLTAKDLLGKDIYDSAGEEIGPVVDVILAGKASPSLKTALSDNDREASANYDSTNAIDPETGSATYAAADPNTANDIGDNEDEFGDEVSETARDLQNRMAGMMANNDEACAVVSYGGLMGIGNDLLIVPISALNYDRNSDQVTLNVNETELDAMIKAGASNTTASTSG